MLATGLVVVPHDRHGLRLARVVGLGDRVELALRGLTHRPVLGLLLPYLPPAASAHVRAATDVLPCRPPRPDRLGPLLADGLRHAGLRVHGLVLLVLVLHLGVVVGLLALVACRDLGLSVVDMLQPVPAHDGRGGHIDLRELLVLLLLHHGVQAAPALERGILG